MNFKETMLYVKLSEDRELLKEYYFQKLSQEIARKYSHFVVLVGLSLSPLVEHGENIC